MANEMVNPQITNSIQAVQQATVAADVIHHSGTGKAYQSIAQTTAITIQDAADQLRNMGTIGTTAIGVALSEMLATGDTTKYEAVLTQITALQTASTANFTAIGKGATDMLNNFQVGK